MRNLRRMSLAASVCLLLACNSSTDVAAPGEVDVASSAQQAKAFSDDAWLRDRIPADTILYARIPSPWRGALGPTGKSTDQMFASQAYVDAIDRMRVQFGKDSIVGSAASPYGALIHGLNSPIEIAMVAAGRIASPAVNVLVSMRVDAADTAAMGTLLGNAVAGGSGPALVLDADGYGTLDAAGTPMQVHYDASTRRLSLLGGMYANLESLKTLRAGILAAKVAPSPMLKLEREVDDSGHGFVVWLDMQAVRPLMGAAAASMEPAAQAFLQQIKTTAFGWGTVAGHGRLSWRAEIAGAAWTQYLPQAKPNFDFKTSGKASLAATMLLPTIDDLARIRPLIEAQVGPEATAEFKTGEAKFAEMFGVDINGLISPFGPEAMSYVDEAGEFAAVRLRDAKALVALREGLVAKLGARYEAREISGGVVHHLALPNWQAGLAEAPADANAEASKWLEVYRRIGNNLYWIEQDGWVVLAGVPQPLIDRLSLGATEPVDTLLKDAGVDPTALITLSGVVDDVSRTMYYGYLQIALAIGDVGNAPFDIFSVPTARQLGLPRETATGMSLVASADHLSMELSYAQNPLEFVSGSGALAMAAVAGVAAAVAIPAYQDYILRASVNNAIAESASLKTMIAEHAAAHGELPDNGADIGAETPIATSDGKSTIDIDAGAILIQFNETAEGLSGKHLYLLPAQTEGGPIEWHCGSASNDVEDLLVGLSEEASATDIEDRYLPVTCRGA